MAPATALGAQAVAARVAFEALARSSISQRLLGFPGSHRHWRQRSARCAAGRLGSTVAGSAGFLSLRVIAVRLTMRVERHAPVRKTLAASMAASTLIVAAPHILGHDQRVAQADFSKAVFVEAMRPKHSRPIIAVVAANGGAETTDFLVPFSVLQRADVATVSAVAPRRGRVALMPALAIEVDTDFASFDRAHPSGADYVIVPALHNSKDADVIAWIKAQASKGAVIVGVCSGAVVLGHAGLLDHRQFTGHWYDRDTLLKRHPTARHVSNQRYLFDRRVVTTTAVAASIPVSLALIEAIAGPRVARTWADRLGVQDWNASQDSVAFRLDWAGRWTVVRNTMLFWRHESIEIEVADRVDAVQLALAADGWSRTYRSRAVTIADSLKPIALGDGVTLLPDQVRAAANTARALRLSPAMKPGCQIDQTLREISERYGSDTSAFVAMQIEYGALDAKMDGCLSVPRRGREPTESGPAGIGEYDGVPL